MAWKLEIAGVDRTSVIDAASGVEIDQPFNERTTARFTTVPGYVPGLRQELTIYAQDGTTPIFGGLIFQRTTRGFAKHMKTECECVDWIWYLDHITVEGGALTGTVTLKQVLQWLQTTYLAAYGFTLDSSQADGPSATVKGFKWERKYVSDALRDLSVWSGGWVFQMDPDKEWRMIRPSLVTPTAPFTIDDSNSNAHDLEWEETSEHYATKVTLVCGGTSNREVDTFVDVGDLIAVGYFITALESTPTGGVKATLDTGSGHNPISVGPVGSGAMLEWDWKLHKVIKGTYVPNFSDEILFYYTAQFPFEVTADAVVTPTIELVEFKDDIDDRGTAQALAIGMLDAAYQSPRTFQITTVLPGLRAGQVITINSALRNASGMIGLITRVSISLVTASTWFYRVTATSGVYTGMGYDFFRQGGGGGGPIGVMPSVSYVDGINTGPITALGTITSGVWHATPIEVAYGGTGLTSLDATRIPVGNGTSPYVSYSHFTFDGSLMKAPELQLTDAGLSIGMYPPGATGESGRTGILCAPVLNNTSYPAGDRVAIQVSPTWNGSVLSDGAIAVAPLISGGHITRWNGITLEPMNTSGSGTFGYIRQLWIMSPTGGSTPENNRTILVEGSTLSEFDCPVQFDGLNTFNGIADFNSTLRHPDYVSQTSRWAIVNTGAADFRYLFVDELHAKSFIADLEQALAGGQIITKSVAMVAQDFTVPAAGAAAALTVRDLPSAPNMGAFVSGDIVAVRTFNRANGGLLIGDAYGTVSGYIDGSGATEGQQAWTWTRLTGSDSGTIPEGTVIPVDAIVLDFGTSGAGYWETTAVDGTINIISITRSGSTATVTSSVEHGYLTGDIVRIDGAVETAYNGNYTITVTSATTFTYTVSGSPSTPATGTILMNGTFGTNAPYAQAVTWAGGSPRAANRTVRARFGNLRGITGTNNEYGMFAGTYSGGTGSFIRASNTVLQLANVPFYMTDGGVAVFNIDPDIPALMLGNPLPTWSSESGVWMGKDSSVYKFRVGNPTGNRVSWDGTDLTVVSNELTIDSNGIFLSQYAFTGSAPDPTDQTAPVYQPNMYAFYDGSGIRGGIWSQRSNDTGVHSTLINCNGGSAGGYVQLMANTSGSIRELRVGPDGVQFIGEVASPGILSICQNAAHGINVRPGAGTDNNLAITNGGGDKFAVRIPSSNSGYDVLIGSTAASVAGTIFLEENINDYACRLRNAHTSSPYGLLIQYTAAAPNGTGNDFWGCFDTGGLRASLRSNGGLANYSANDVNLSDATVKDLHGPAPSQLEAVKRLQFHAGRYVGQTRPTDDVMLTAQQVADVYPDLVEPFSADLLGVREQQLLMRGLKAVQELIARVEALEARP